MKQPHALHTAYVFMSSGTVNHQRHLCGTEHDVRPVSWHCPRAAPLGHPCRELGVSREVAMESELLAVESVCGDCIVEYRL